MKADLGLGVGGLLGDLGLDEPAGAHRTTQNMQHVTPASLLLSVRDQQKNGNFYSLRGQKVTITTQRHTNNGTR